MRTIEPHDALRLLNGGPVALLTTRFRNETNVMPVIWTVSLSRRPPLIGVAVNPSRYTHDMVRFAEEFSLNFPGQDLLNHAHYFGAVSGADVGKLELAKLPTFKASKVSAPLIEHCLAYVECSLEDAIRLGDHTLFVGRVLVVQAEEEAFDETWRIEDRDYRPLHYLGIDRYAVLGERLQAELRTTDEGAIELAESKEERERREEAEALERERRQREGEE
ncbi:MAG TPA: flavin reductase family protein [Dehalococcoidia bacterium]|jgi:flavin reductase (DIM6/NTAB) family NADH-FMN oxidoreductase RutF|nr:flavin reductase family protein [Dehalococcoidia bacterium]